MPGSLGAEPGAEDTGVAATMDLRSTILRGLTMGRMLMLSGPTVPERRRAGAATPLPGNATSRE